MKQPVKSRVRLETIKFIYSRGSEAGGPGRDIHEWDWQRGTQWNATQNSVGIFVTVFFRRERVYRNCEVLKRVCDSENMIQCLSNYHNGKTKREPWLCFIKCPWKKVPFQLSSKIYWQKVLSSVYPNPWHLLPMQALGKFSGNSKQLLTNTHPKERTRHFSHISSCLKCSFFGKEEKKKKYIFGL